MPSERAIDRVLASDLLGRVADRKLASILHTSSRTVSEARRLRDVPPCCPKRRIDWSRVSFDAPNTAIARALGVSETAVRKARRNLPTRGEA